MVNARFAAPLDRELLQELASREGVCVLMEENELAGSWCESAARVLFEENAKCRPLFLGVPNRFVRHGTVEELSKEQGLDAASVAERVRETL